MIRRVVVLTVFIALLIGVVGAVGTLFDGDDESRSAGDLVSAGDDLTTDVATDVQATGTVVPADGAAAVPGATGPTALGSDPSATTTTVPASSARVPTTADPARVLLLGDSEAGGLSPFLEPVIEASGLVAMTTEYKVSSGLVRTDFYDWPAKLRELMAAQDPDIVIALFGGNDGQGFQSPVISSVDSAEWRAEYARRVAEVVDIVTEGDRTLIWVGVPNAESESLTANLRVQNESVEAELANHPAVLFVDAWGKFTGIDGGFAPYAFDPRDGETKPVRSETDGFHLNRTGEEILAVYVNSAVTDALRARGAAVG